MLRETPFDRRDEFVEQHSDHDVHQNDTHEQDVWCFGSSYSFRLVESLSATSVGREVKQVARSTTITYRPPLLLRLLFLLTSSSVLPRRTVGRRGGRDNALGRGVS